MYAANWGEETKGVLHGLTIKRNFADGLGN